VAKEWTTKDLYFESRWGDSFSRPHNDQADTGVQTTYPNPFYAKSGVFCSKKKGVGALTFQSLQATLRTTRFSIQKFYIVNTWNLCVVYGSRIKQQILP